MKISLRERLLVLTASSFLLSSWPHPATAQLLGPEFQINSYTTNDQSSPVVAADGMGRFLVAWESDLQNGALRGGGSPFRGLFAQRFNAASVPVGGE